MRARFLVTALAAVIAVGPAFADPVDLKLDRTRDKFNLGVADFYAADKSVATSVPQNATAVVAGDMKFSTLFNLVEHGPNVQNRNEALQWKPLGSDVVVSGSVKARGGDQIEIQAKLFDTGSGKEVLTVTKTGSTAGLRDLAHEVSNDIVKYFTGQPGIFTSKIVFTNNTTGRKELYIADYDGRGAKRLTNDNSICVLPRISPDGKKIVFTSYMAGNPDLYVINRDGTGRRKLSSKAGLNVSPSWAPTSDKLAVTLSVDGPPSLYIVDLNGNISQRLTNQQGADTAPTFSPDGLQIAFTSDRAGAPHIYIMNLDGTGARRITTASHCDSAAWSPDGQTILYVKGGGGKEGFDIFSIEVLTGIERQLTWGGGDNENPAWSPDGRSILFVSKRRGRHELYMMSSDGSDQRPLSVNNGECFTPHWSR